MLRSPESVDAELREINYVIYFKPLSHSLRGGGTTISQINGVMQRSLASMVCTAMSGMAHFGAEHTTFSAQTTLLGITLPTHTSDL